MDESTRLGFEHSSQGLATDPHSGRSYLVREYVPDQVPDAAAQRRRFIAAAKSLRSCPLAAQRVHFAYTRHGRCYTVSEPVKGTPLAALAPLGRTSEADCLARLAMLLDAVGELHSAGASAGPLFHGALRGDDVLLATNTGDAGAHLLHPRYLDNLLREHPLPPEHFQGLDLVAVAEIVLGLAQGASPAMGRQARLQRVNDPLLGATLEYLFGAHGGQPTTARAALEYLHLLQRAAQARDHRLFAQARSLSPSPRLLSLATPPAPPSRPPEPAKPAAAPPPPPPPPKPPPAAPPQIPYTPVPTSPPPARPPAPRPAVRKRGGGCGGCLLTLLFALLVVGAVVTALRNRPTTPTRLDFAADPNPAPRKAHVQLRWSSSGFDRLELDGKRVQSNGSLMVIPTMSHRYTLAGVRRDGSRELRELTLSLLPRRTAAKPGHDLSTAPAPMAEPAAPTDDRPDPLPAAQGSAPGGQAGLAAAPVVTPGVPLVQQDASADVAGVNAALTQWRTAMLSNDPDREAACYAPHLDRYFLHAGVDQGFVRQYLHSLRSRGTQFSQFELSSPLTLPQPDGSVEVRLHKEVTLASPAGVQHEATRSVLQLKRVDGAWKITSERDFRTPETPR